MASENQEKTNFTVWRTFEREINGKLTKFWIQTLCEKDKEKSLKYLCEVFPKDEPMTRSLDIVNDEVSFKTLRELWKVSLDQNISLGCYTQQENGENELVGLNCLVKKEEKDEKPLTIKGEAAKILLGTLLYMDDLKNPFKALGLNAYLGAMGLFTLPKYRGHNIGLELLNARENLCKALGLKATVTSFTAPASQRLAEKAGFQDLVAVTYDEIATNKPEFKIQTINNYSKILRHMYRRYD